MLGRLDDLSPEQRRVVDAAAILGRRVSFDLLTAVAGSGETSSSPSSASWWPGT